MADTSSRPEDAWGAVAAFVISFLVYLRHLAPDVSLLDSGELVTAAYHFGVAHPPGYPLWVLFGYLWSHVIVPFGNPAWRIGSMSAFTGGLLVGLMAFMMTRTTRRLLQTIPAAHATHEPLRRWLATTVGVGTALLFGFTHGVWYWACLPEIHIQNAFAFVLIACVFCLWVTQPERQVFLYATLLLLAAGIANHRAVAALAWVVPFGVLMIGLERLQPVCTAQSENRPGNLRLHLSGLGAFWEIVAAAAIFKLAQCLLAVWSYGDSPMQFMEMPSPWEALGFLVAGVGVLILVLVPLWSRAACVGAAVLVATIAGCLLVPSFNVSARSRGFMELPYPPLGHDFFLAGLVLLVLACSASRAGFLRALLCAGSLLAGVSGCLLTPLAAWTNPPMNWGYAATRYGLLHMLSRGSYEKFRITDLGAHEFVIRAKMLLHVLVHPFGWPLCAFGLVTIAATIWLLVGWRRRSRGHSAPWLLVVLAAVLATSMGLFENLGPYWFPRSQASLSWAFAPAHFFCAILIGYGIALTVWLVFRLCGNARPALLQTCCVALLALPLVTYQANRTRCALETYDFGYEFGHRIFRPGGRYADMESGAIFFGGTEAGRFVSTYMVFCESRVRPNTRFHDKTFDRSDVYVICQNALADNTYMSYIRDQYDFSRPGNMNFVQRLLGRDLIYPREPIHLPTPEDSNRAFQQYAEDVHSGRTSAYGTVNVNSNRVSVSGVGGVMAINGIIAKWIFDQNKDVHPFYVEESYVLPWMYPYLRPAGVILKIEQEPLPSPQEKPEMWQEIVAQDRVYWDVLTATFTSRADFHRNDDAQKTFAKLRVAIAGLYAFRGLTVEAEYAFRQALMLCPECLEVNFRLADLYMQKQRYAEAREVMERCHRADPENSNVSKFLEQIKAAQH